MKSHIHFSLCRVGQAYQPAGLPGLRARCFRFLLLSLISAFSLQPSAFADDFYTLITDTNGIVTNPVGWWQYIANYDPAFSNAVIQLAPTGGGGGGITMGQAQAAITATGTTITNGYTAAISNFGQTNQVSGTQITPNTLDYTSLKNLPGSMSIAPTNRIKFWWISTNVVQGTGGPMTNITVFIDTTNLYFINSLTVSGGTVTYVTNSDQSITAAITVTAGGGGNVTGSALTSGNVITGAGGVAIQDSGTALSAMALKSDVTANAASVTNGYTAAITANATTVTNGYNAAITANATTVTNGYVAAITANATTVTNGYKAADAANGATITNGYTAAITANAATVTNGYNAAITANATTVTNGYTAAINPAPITVTSNVVDFAIANRQRTFTTNQSLSFTVLNVANASYPVVFYLTNSAATNIIPSAPAGFGSSGVPVVTNGGISAVTFTVDINVFSNMWTTPIR